MTSEKLLQVDSINIYSELMMCNIIALYAKGMKAKRTKQNGNT